MSSQSTPAKVTVAEIKQKYAQIAEKYKILKQNQAKLQAGINDRDLAIDSRDKRLSECERINEESIARMQLKDYQLAELFNTITEKDAALAAEVERSTALQRKLDAVGESEVEKSTALQSKLDAVGESEIEIERLREENRKLKEDISQLAMTHDDIAHLQSKVEALESERDSGAEREEKLAQSLRELQAEQRELRLAGISGDASIESELKKQSERIFALETELQTANIAAERMRLTLKQANVDIVALNERNKRFEELNQALKSDTEAVKVEYESQMSALRAEIQKRDVCVAEFGQMLKAKNQELIDESEKAVHRTTRAMETAAIEHAKAMERLRSQFEDDKASMKEQLSDMSAENAKRVKEVMHLKNAMSDHDQLSSDKATLESNMAALMEKKTGLEDQLRGLAVESKSRVQELLNQCGSLEAKNIDMRLEMESLQEFVRDAKLALTKSDLLCQSVTSERDKFVTKNETLQAKYDEQKQCAESLQRETADLKPQLAKTRSEFQESERVCRKALLDLNELQKRSKERELSMQRSIEEITQLSEDTQSKVDLLETELSALRETAAYREADITAQLTAVTAKAEEDERLCVQLAATKKQSEKRLRSVESVVAQLEAEKHDIEQKCEGLRRDLSTRTQSSGSTIFPKYMRKVLLQFFLQDANKRESLIPVILTLVECDEKLIQQAKRNWAETSQIISRTFSFFK